jgi:CHAT domain-containing protein
MNGEVDIEPFLGDKVPSQAFQTPLPAAIADQLVERLKKDAERYLRIDGNRSLELSERIIAIGQARGDKRQIAMGMMARGDALKLLGQTAEAWDAFENAGEMFRTAGDEVGWARTYIGRLYLSIMLNRVSQALLDAEQARQIFVRYGEREKLLRLAIQTAYVHNHIGNQRQALHGFQSALSLAEELGEHGQPYFGVLYANLGSTYEGLGDLHQAQDFYELARAVFIADGETLHLATVEANLGHLAHSQGNYRRALQLLNQSLERASGHSDLETTKIKWHVQECYLGLNRLLEARDSGRQIVEDYRQFKDDFELARALWQLAMVEAELSNFEAALAALDEAEGIYTSLEASTWVAKIWLCRGRIALNQGDASQARKWAQEALAVFDWAAQNVNRAIANLLAGQAGLALGDLGSARTAGMLALSMARHEHHASLRYSSHLLLGQVYEASHNLGRATRHYTAAAWTVERFQRTLTITISPGFLEDKTEAWRALIRLYLQEDRPGKAFEILERSKSQVLLGYLANRDLLHWAKDEAGSRGLVEEFERLRSEYQWFYRMAYDESPASDHHSPMDSQQALIEAKTRERKMRSITERLYLHSAEGKTPDPARTPSLSEIQEALDSDTLMLAFYNDGYQVWAFSVDNESIQVHPLRLTVEALNQLVAQLQMNMTAALSLTPESKAANNLKKLGLRILQRLYKILIEPLASRGAGKRRWVIVPYGALHYLPFHLLHDGTRYLFERRETVILPAAGLLTHSTPKGRVGALILAHSWEGRLLHTITEGQVLQRLLGGSLLVEKQAGREALKAPPAQILHLSAHGQYRLDQPDLSYIQLSDGQLYADDLLQQDMSYELVTLSACETGRANVAGGEELIGLGRGFMYAGAGALVLSLWPVADRISVRLMEIMYQGLKNGDSKAAALRSAQRQVLAENPQLHPAFWGAFQLVGNAGPLS